MLKRESVPSHTLELLEKLSGVAFSNGFYLAGGTALALRFGHRLSVDLDFFKNGEFSVHDVIAMVSLVSDEIRVVNRSEYSVAMIVDRTKVEFLRYDYKELEPVEEIEGVYLSSFLDNSLMKLSAVTGRGAKKDFCDLVEILQRSTIEDLLSQFSQKYPQTDPFIVLKSITWFEDAELDPDPVFLTEQNWSAVKKGIIDAVRHSGE